MEESETVMSAIEVAASNPKVAMTVAAATTSLGAASAMEWVQGALSIGSLLIGCLVGLFVIRVHMIKYRILLRDWENGTSDGEAIE